MATKQQLKTLERYVDAIHEILIDQISGLRLRQDRTLLDSRSIYVRMLGQILYEAPKLHTGMVSMRLIEQKLNNFSTKPCLEHHHSRQKGGMALIDLIERSIQTNVEPTKDQVRDIALQYCQVHYTTSGENAMLRKHQRNCTSEAAYRRSNIQLMEAPELFRKRGKHPQTWKDAMRDKYGPAVEQYNNPVHEQVEFDMPLVIH